MNPKISELLTKINSLLSEQTKAPLAPLEFDLLKQHIRTLYEKTIEQQSTFTAPSAEMQRVKETVYEPIVTKIIQETKTLQPKHKPVEVETVIEQPEETGVSLQNRIAEHKIETSPSLETNFTSTIIEQQSKTTTASLNEKWVNTSIEMHKKLASKPLRELIDFNKRFAIVNELFKGDTEAFQQAVGALDAAASYDQAEATFVDLANKRSWDPALQTTRLFSKLIKQRFGVE